MALTARQPVTAANLLQLICNFFGQTIFFKFLPRVLRVHAPAVNHAITRNLSSLIQGLGHQMATSKNLMQGARALSSSQL